MNVPKIFVGTLLCAVLFLYACVYFGTPPGKGERAEEGYKLAAPVLAALAHYHETQAGYPDSLAQLVPTFLAQSALSPRNARFATLQYRRDTGGFALEFRYVGPGMNTCTIRSVAPGAKWECGGYY